MKLYHILILTIILNINKINGQVEKNIIYGLKAGSNYTLPKVVDLKSMKFSNQLGLDLGIFADLDINDRSGLKLELLYSFQNFNMDSYKSDIIGDENGIFQLDARFKNKYIYIPILYKWKLVEKLDFLIGPQLGYLISEQKKFSVNDGRIGFSNEEIERIERFNISGDFELSYCPNKNVNLGLRYSLGIIKTNTLRNSGLQFYIGYVIL